MDCLCYMWEAPKRGELRGPDNKLARMLDCTEEEFDLFVLEAEKYGFADVTFSDDVTNCPREVTIINRRMSREQKVRNDARLRKQRQRSRQTGHDEVTAPSSTSSSTSTSTSKKKRSTSSSELLESCEAPVEESPSSSLENESRPEEPQYPEDGDSARLSQLLFDLIRQRDPKFKPRKMQKWAVHIDRLIRRDSRSPPEIEAVIRWRQADGFWQSNILSTEKLREKFSQLFLKMQSEAPTGLRKELGEKAARTAESAQKWLEKNREG